MPGDLHDRMRPPLLEGGTGAVRVPPRCALDPAPPLAAGDADSGGCLLECGAQVAAENEGPAKFFSLGLVAGGIDEGVKGFVGDAGFIEIERRELYSVNRTFSVCEKTVVTFIAHEKFTARDELHSVGRSVGDANESRALPKCGRIAGGIARRSAAGFLRCDFLGHEGEKVSDGAG